MRKIQIVLIQAYVDDLATLTAKAGLALMPFTKITGGTTWVGAQGVMPAGPHAGYPVFPDPMYIQVLWSLIEGNSYIFPTLCAFSKLFNAPSS